MFVRKINCIYERGGLCNKRIKKGFFKVLFQPVCIEILEGDTSCFFKTKNNKPKPPPPPPQKG